MTASDLGARLAVSLFALAFALAFTYGGVWVCLLPLSAQVREAWAAERYVPVPAKVESITLDQYHSKKGGTTYRAKAEFLYAFEGRPYLGQRVSIARTSDGPGGHQESLYQQLRDARNNDRPVDLWVDPRDPERSVYDREMLWDKAFLQLVFGLLLTPIGLGAWVFFYRAWRV